MSRRRQVSRLAIAVILGIGGTVMAADDMTVREQVSLEVSMALMKQLGSALKEEMSTTGAVGAIGACKDLAPRIAGEISRQKGWRMTRVSSKPRNPMLGMPDAWEQKVLVQFEARVAKGEDIDRISVAEVVEEPDGRYFRYMKAIGVQPLCLTCHGSPEQIPDPVKAKLVADYPMDRATGYRMGDLRGAFSIKQPLD